MEKTPKKPSLKLAIWSLLMTCLVVPVFGGTPGAFVSSTGYGKAVARITYGGKTNIATTAISSFQPCAAINPQGGFSCTYTSPLPIGTPPTVYCQARGFQNNVWSIQAYVTGGATADAPELDAKVNIVPANCASYSLDSSSEYPDANTALYTVKAAATSGAAIWVRVVEFLGDGFPETLEELTGNGNIKADYVAVGPFDLGYNDECKALNLHVHSDLGNDHLYLVVDGTAHSVPLGITCPNDLVFDCDDTVAYPTPTTIGGCGDLDITYSIAPGDIPLGETTQVTATVTDENETTASCTFNVTRQYNPLTITCPGDLVFTCGDTVAYPTIVTSGGCGTVSVTFDKQPGELPDGTSVVVATASDQAGGSQQCSFNVTRESLSFVGYQAPVGGIGGTCEAPLRTVNRGSNVPLKFTVSCAGTPVTTGTPTMAIEKATPSATVGNGCPTTPAGGGNFVSVGSEFHFNWDTTGIAKGTYKLTATLQDGSTRFVWIKIK